MNKLKILSIFFIASQSMAMDTLEKCALEFGDCRAMGGDLPDCMEQDSCQYILTNAMEAAGLSYGALAYITMQADPKKTRPLTKTLAAITTAVAIVQGPEEALCVPLGVIAGMTGKGITKAINNYRAKATPTSNRTSSRLEITNG